MRKTAVCFISIVLAFFLSVNTVFAITTEDYENVIKITKKLRKLSDKGKTEEIAKYYSENYKSFDGYNKEETLNIFESARELYPKIKTKEKIEKVETKDDTIKVYITENSYAKLDVKGADAKYAVGNKIKGRMDSKAYYSMIYKKEGEDWKVIGDEIYSESTEIKYGEAIEADFDMEIPKSITAGEEYTVKITLQMPINRFVVGSIGHDKIVYPPEKSWDPYRAINKSGILERVMIANKEGENEYANSTFAFINPFVKIKKNDKNIDTEKAVISGLGFYVKRINTDETVKKLNL